jgi:Tol biopolymer transport system component
MAPIVQGDRNDCYPWGRPGECPDIYLLERSTGHLERVSISSSEREGNGRSTEPAISPDGRFIAFASTASNLVAGDTNHGNMCYDSLPNYINCSDIFVRDQLTGITSRASVG